MLSDESREAIKTVAAMAARIHAAKIVGNNQRNGDLLETIHHYDTGCTCVEEARRMFNETIDVLQGETRK